jgi:hypothetical protein
LTGLKRQIDQWDLSKYNIMKDDNLINFVGEEWLNNSTHKEILLAIERTPALNLPHTLISRQLKTLRLENGLIYARRDNFSEAEVEQKKQAIITAMKDGGGARLGRGQLMVALRGQGMLISQYTLREMMKEVDPSGVEGRKISRRRRRGRMDIAGPGRVWSCDGYDKLKP